MSNVNHLNAGFLGWAKATALAFILLSVTFVLLSVIWAACRLYDVRGEFDFTDISMMGLIAALGIPVIIPVLISGILNWGYERQHKEDVFYRWYRHPETLTERVVCVIGGAVCVVAAPFLGFLIWASMFAWALS